MGLSSFGQTTREEMYSDLGRCGGVYYAYHVPTSQQTPCPKGYTPFYISHYGRHGSRYLLNDKDYTGLQDILRKAHDAHSLTDVGESLLTRVDTLCSIANGHGDELAPLGARQQHDIADRMYHSFPQVFRPGGHISARSTTSMRCALSMAAFCEGLKENQPRLDIYRETSRKYMDYLNYHTQEHGAFNGDNGPWRDQYERFEISHLHPERMVRSLFCDSTFIARNINPTQFMWKVYWVCVDAQDMDTDVRIYDVFTPDELFDIWQCFNYRFYVCDANCALNHGLAIESAQHLVHNIIESVDKAIAGNGEVATLRFGHDGNIIPLAAALHLEGCDVSISNPDDFYKVWCDWKVAPMGANIQIIFYHKGTDVLVKFLLNEEEKHLPIPSVTGPYYRWEDVKAFLLSD